MGIAVGLAVDFTVGVAVDNAVDVSVGLAVGELAWHACICRMGLPWGGSPWMARAT